jgi:hypothetical protein
MILTVVHDYQARLRSYQLVAETMGLTARSAKAPHDPVTRTAT